MKYDFMAHIPNTVWYSPVICPLHWSVRVQPLSLVHVALWRKEGGLVSKHDHYLLANWFMTDRNYVTVPSNNIYTL